MNRTEFKRKTLIKNIERVLTKAQQEELPAIIKEVQAFGGILRDKEKVHDFDAVFLFDQTPEQTQMWDRFRRNFNNAIDDNREISRKQLNDILQPYYKRDIPLSKVVMTDSVFDLLKNYGIKPKWAACFSWTDFYFSFLGIFYPDINKVLRKLLLKGVRGIQAIFENYQEFKQGGTMLVAKNFQLAWSPERPNVSKNLEMPKEEKITYLANEFLLFQTQLVSLKEQLLKLQTGLISATTGTDLKLNFEKLNSAHACITLDKNETHRGLIAKCELARREMRNYNEEISVLRNLKSSIENFQQREKDTLYPLPSECTMRELATSWTLSSTPKYEVKEMRIREILGGLGLPEDHVITIRHYGTKTYYTVEVDIDKRKELLAAADEERNKNQYLRRLNRLAKSFDKNFYVDIAFSEGNPASLIIRYHRWSDNENDSIKKEILPELKRSKFNVRQDTSFISANKILRIEGTRTIKELEVILRKALEKYGQT
jgi:hypothetical protein